MEKHKETPPEIPAQQHRPDGSEILTDKQIAAAVRKKSFPTWVDLLAIIGMFVLSNLLVGALVLSLLGGESGLAVFLSYAGTFLITIAFALTLTKRRTGTVKNILSFSFKGFNPSVILWGLILMLAANVVIEPLIELFPSQWYDLVTEQISAGGWATVTAVVLAPILEEMLFRGIIQDSLVRKRGPWSGILIASAIFGLIHGIPQQVVAGFCLGIIIGFVYYKTRSLLSVIVLHAINNALATFMNLFESEEGGIAGQSLRDLIGNDPVYWAVFAFCAVLLIVSLVQVQVSIRKGRERRMLKTEEKSTE